MFSINNAVTTPLSNLAQIEHATDQLIEAARTVRVPVSSQQLATFKENFRSIENACVDLENRTTDKRDLLMSRVVMGDRLAREMNLLSTFNAACSAPSSEMVCGPLSFQSTALIAENKRLRENGLSIWNLPANELPPGLLACAPKWLQYENEMRALMNGPLVRKQLASSDWIKPLQKGLQIHYGLPVAGALSANEKQSLAVPLYLAIISGSASVVASLVRAGADIHRGPEGLSAPLGAALKWRQHESLQILLKAGANPNDDIFWKSQATAPLAKARSCGDTRSIELLLHYGAADAH